MKGDYGAAVAALNTLQSNFSIVDAIRKSGKGMNQNAIPEMIQWVKRIGYEPSDFDKLNAIHVAGTKGKGSTSSFVSSIISQCDRSPANKVGLYTSPHLRFVRERIQIDNKPMSEDMFARYFFDIWNRLEESAEKEGHPDPQSKETKPVYFRFLTLVALHTYMSEGVNCAVIECGIGGEYDSTNILVNPYVCAVTSLGIDHTAVLGDTIESIAWHKAGIFKPGAPAFTAPQPDSALRVLEERAEERGTTVTIVPTHPLLENGDVKLGLAADFQKTNASLAIAVASAWLEKMSRGDISSLPTESNPQLSHAFREGLEQVKLGGRCEIREDTAHNLTWHIDGGHTLESIEMAGRWFASLISEKVKSQDKTPRVLIFNQQTRDADRLAKKLHSTLTTALQPTLSSNDALSGQTSSTVQPFTHVVFCTNETYVDAGYKADLTSINTNAADVEALSVQNALAKTWTEVDPDAHVKVVRTVEEAIRIARGVAKDGKEQVEVLVTGSLHLVGGVVEVLGSENERGSAPLLQS
ncbi:Mur ligase [Delphinella strobiligena]|nr:Mur ligase [Delphinella strobiligena]